MSIDFLNLNQQDVFDIRDVIERYEELTDDPERDEDEFQMLTEFLEEVRGQGGDEQWLGDWYPVTFIRDSYFTSYAEEFAEDIGAIWIFRPMRVHRSETWETRIPEHVSPAFRGM